MTAGVAQVELVPRTIGPYELLYEIGRGGMGVVYRAARIGGGPPVALKIPSEDMADLFGCVRREIHALSRLRHPGIVNIIEEGVEKGVPWYAMELLEARSLDELLGIVDTGEADFDVTNTVLPFERSGIRPVTFSMLARPEVRGDLQRALTLMYRLARVLAYVHSHGIVHRDLKPQNVLVRTGDRPVLVDFGLMGQFRAQSGRETLEIGGLMMGTAMYAAPEQASGELVDARADLYSFGAMLYEIVAGVPPFLGRSVRDVLMMHLTQAPAPPSQHVRGIPPVLEKLILTLLEKRRADRLGYAEDVAELLGEAGAEPDPDFKVETAAYLYRPEIIGRKETTDWLRNRLPAVRKGEGAFVMLGGVSGIGKTSVAAEVARDATIGGFFVVTAECDPVGGQPLHPIRPLLREIADHCRGQEDVLERVLGSRIHVLRDHEPAIAALAGEDEPRIPPEIASRRLFTDLAETLAAFAREKPLLLIVDDLQWADELTLRFLSSLGAEFFNDLPLVILGTYRAEETGPDLRALLGREHLAKILLNRLDDANIAEIVRSMLAAPNAPESFLNFLAAQTEGNPFFVAEYLRAAVAEQLLFRENGRWHVRVRDETYASLGLPGTVRDLVARRLDRLSPLAQRIAEAAAVLGREVPEAQLIAVCGESEIGAIEGIAELIRQHVFESMEHGVRFAHDRLREGAYARIGDERRKLLHARAADVIEAGCATDDERARHAAGLARHCDIAGLEAKAIAYYAQAGETAVASGAGREAVDAMNRALELDAPNVDAKDRPYRHARWHRVLSFAHYGLGNLPKSAEEARRSLSEVGIHLPESEHGWRLRLAAETVRQAAQLLLPRRFTRASPSRIPVIREITLAALKFSEGRYFTSERTAMLASGMFVANRADRIDDVPVIVYAYANIATYIGTAGFFRLARYYFSAARRLAYATNNITALAHIGHTSSSIYGIICDWKSCALYLEDAVAAAKKLADDQTIEMNETGFGIYQFNIGNLERAEALFAAVRDRAHKRNNLQHETWGKSFRAGVLILLDRLDEALAEVDSALKMLEGVKDANMRLGNLQNRCVALMHQGKLDAALEAADVAYDTVSRATMIVWERYRALSGPAQVYLEAWRARGDDPVHVERMRRAVKVLVKRLQGVTRRIPLARPTLLRLMGITECLEGNHRRGEKLLRKAIAAAVRLQLPIDEGIGEYELARHAKLDAAARAEHRQRARAIFRNIGCSLYLRKLNDEGA